MMKSKKLVFIVLVFFCCSLLSAISVRETDLALSSTLDGALSVVASVMSHPQIPLQGVSAMYEDSGLAKEICFTRSDLSSYLESLSFTQERERRWYETLLNQSEVSIEPIRSIAISYLESSSYEKGSVILDGTINIKTDYVENPEALIEFSSFDSVSIPLELSLIITALEFDEPLIIEGEIEIIGGLDGQITVYSDNLSINGEIISFSPFEIDY